MLKILKLILLAPVRLLELIGKGLFKGGKAAGKRYVSRQVFGKPDKKSRKINKQKKKIKKQKRKISKAQAKVQKIRDK